MGFTLKIGDIVMKGENSPPLRPRGSILVHVTMGLKCALKYNLLITQLIHIVGELKS